MSSRETARPASTAPPADEAIAMLEASEAQRTELRDRTEAARINVERALNQQRDAATPEDEARAGEALNAATSDLEKAVFEELRQLDAYRSLESRFAKHLATTRARTTRRQPTFTLYIGDERKRRIDRLEELGTPVDISKTCQASLDQAIETAERTIGGDRMARLLARLEIARTPSEQAEANAVAAGMRWAEDVAAMSELEAVEALLRWMTKFESVGSITVSEGRVWVDLLEPDDEINDDIEGRRVVLPESVPVGFFREAAEQSSHRRVAVTGFLHGGWQVLNAVREARAQRVAPELSDATVPRNTGDATAF